MGLCFGDHVLFYRCKTRVDVCVCVCVCVCVRGGVCVTYLHSVEDLEEGVGHAATKDHFIHFVQHVLNQLWLMVCVCLCVCVRACVCVCVTYLHAVQDLEEGVGHAATDDHFIHLVQHVLNQLDLVLNLGPEIHTQIYITK